MASVRPASRQTLATMSGAAYRPKWHRSRTLLPSTLNPNPMQFSLLSPGQSLRALTRPEDLQNRPLQSGAFRRFHATAYQRAAAPPSKAGKQHDYTCRIDWTGNRGDGTRNYRSYDRTWDVVTPGKPTIHCSNDPLLGGNPDLPNPEDLLLASLSACHMLWYLHLASSSKIVIHRYTDDPIGVGEGFPDGSGQFLSATLRPSIVVAKGTDLTLAEKIHHDVHKYCFIARSVKFPVSYAPKFEILDS